MASTAQFCLQTHPTSMMDTGISYSTDGQNSAYLPVLLLIHVTDAVVIYLIIIMGQRIVLILWGEDTKWEPLRSIRNTFLRVFKVWTECILHYDMTMRLGGPWNGLWCFAWEMSPIGLGIWWFALQLVVLFGKVMGSLGSIALLEKYDTGGRL